MTRSICCNSRVYSWSMASYRWQIGCWCRRRSQCGSSHTNNGQRLCDKFFVTHRPETCHGIPTCCCIKAFITTFHFATSNTRINFSTFVVSYNNVMYKIAGILIKKRIDETHFRFTRLDALKVRQGYHRRHNGTRRRCTVNGIDSSTIYYHVIMTHQRYIRVSATASVEICWDFQIVVIRTCTRVIQTRGSFVRCILCIINGIEISVDSSCLIGRLTKQCRKAPSRGNQNGSSVGSLATNLRCIIFRPLSNHEQKKVITHYQSLFFLHTNLRSLLQQQ